MIITHLAGGLGNQMFQFAAGFSLARRLSTLLKVDTSFYKLYATNRFFELDKIFANNVQLEFATPRDIKSILGSHSLIYFSPFIRRIAKKVFSHKKWLVEPELSYWHGFHNISDNVIIEGNWQSEKYFTEHKVEIKSLFKFDHFLSSATQYLESILTSNSVSVHIRRGDYIENQYTLSYHGVCKEDYYIDSVEQIKTQIKDPFFFVFSDDKAVANKIFNSTNTNFVVVNNFGENAAYVDLALMIKCKSHIIANSTFSWWGAYLSNAPDKIVIAPKKWYAKPNLKESIIPFDWIRV